MGVPSGPPKSLPAAQPCPSHTPTLPPYSTCPSTSPLPVIYENARQIASAIENSKIPRSSLFLVSKLQPYRFTEDIQTLINHITALGTTYLDLILLHAPGSGFDHQFQAWSKLEDLYRKGVVKNLGVANFNLTQLQQLMEKATIKPKVLQNKFDVYHPGHLQCQVSNDLFKYCREHSIIIDAHSPLSGWPFMISSLNESHVQSIAEDHQCSPAQVILRWILQKGHSVVTQSTNPQHILENFSIFNFELSEEEVKRIDGVSWFVASGINNPSDGFENVYGVEWPMKD